MKLFVKCHWFGWYMVFNATFNNISVILWWSVSLVKEQCEQTLSHNVVSSTPRHERGLNSQL
jgi:hypothetical protein